MKELDIKYEYEYEELFLEILERKRLVNVFKFFKNSTRKNMVEGIIKSLFLGNRFFSSI